MAEHSKESQSLTPMHRADETAWDATYEGLVNGFMTLVPTAGALYVAMRNPTFVKRTNWQSRTAMVIMPALFVFGLTAEKHLEHRMKEIAEENKHKNATVVWAEKQYAQEKESGTHTHVDMDAHFTELYQQSVEDSGVQIIPGDKLGAHHRMANWAAENPIKLLAGLAIPSVSLILYGRTGQQHLQFSHMLLHTRVFGQFATLSCLLGVMGFKDYMDRNGKFITQAEADARVEEMKEVRRQLLTRLAQQNEYQKHVQEEIAAAHEQDVKEHNVHVKKPMKKKKSERAAAAAQTISH